MRKLVDPQQTRLFDPFEGVLTHHARKHLLDNWPEIFRHDLLKRMPAGTLAEHFDPVMGRPSKEFYSNAGLTFRKNASKGEFLLKYKSIKQLVFEMIHDTQGSLDYLELERKVLEHFPESAFKRTHWSWYRNQCVKGKYADEFSDIEKENFSNNTTHLKKKDIPVKPIIGESKLEPSQTSEIQTLKIDKNALDILYNIISSALDYEEITGNNRKVGITGEVGEVLACYHLGLRLSIDPRAAGYDAIDSDGNKVQIKTRRSESEGLPKDAGRIGTFSNHPFDYVLLVLLDRNYQVAEIWKSGYCDVIPLVEKNKRRNPNLSSFKKISQRIWRSY